MELIDYVRMLGRRWRWWVSLLVLATAAAVAYVHVAHKSYTATSEEVVTSNVSKDTSAAAWQQSRTTIIASMASYPALVKSPSVVNGVLEDVPDIKLTPSQLSARLSAEYVPRTVLLKVHALSGNPQIAAELSTAAAKRLAIAIENIETDKAGAPSQVRVVLTRPAAIPASPSSPNKMLTIALGVLAGLGLGLIAASLRDQAMRGKTPASAGSAGSPPANLPVLPTVPAQDSWNGSLAAADDSPATSSVARLRSAGSASARKPVSPAVSSMDAWSGSSPTMDAWPSPTAAADDQAVADVMPPDGTSRH